MKTEEDEDVDGIRLVEGKDLLALATVLLLVLCLGCFVVGLAGLYSAPRSDWPGWFLVSGVILGGAALYCAKVVNT